MVLKRIARILLFCGFAAFLPAAEPVLWADYEALRDGMYNRVSGEEFAALYEKARNSAATLFSGPALLTALSKCEYMMGRNSLYEAQKDKAGGFFDRGAEMAQLAADESGLADAWVMYAENISQNCTVKPVSYVLANGPKISSIANRVLKLDPGNGAAYHLLYAQHIYAPAPFHNYRKGIKNFTAVLADKSSKLQKDDSFNITSAIGYGYYQLKEYDEAALWFYRALELYPANSFVTDMLLSALNAGKE